jgi:3-oxoacyl-[acyl-carrier protein] reductase
MVDIDLSGKTALITGAGQGLGASTAMLLAVAGANTVINYFLDPEGKNAAQAQRTAREIGGRAQVFEADVRDARAVSAMFDRTVGSFGSVEIVVNNAAVIRDRTIKNMSEEEWQEVIDTNLTGTFNVCREAARRIADGGRIVNISSISGTVGFYGQTNYAASKAGILGLTRSLSRELAARRITVNAVAPGVVLTEIGLTIPEDVREQMLKSVPLGRFGEPHEVAGAILFLCSDLASYITGQVIHVNGGWTG